MPFVSKFLSPSDILIPFGLPPAEHAKDLVRMLTSECGKDGLAMLLSRYQSLDRRQFDHFSPELPHEAWLNEQFKRQHYSLLQHYADIFHVDLDAGHWFLLNPVHLHIARNHLVLTDYRQLNLSESQARLLFEKAKPLCEDAGVELIYGDATIWFLRADEWSGLVTSSPDAACGHNIEIWSPKGVNEIAWRKLQNEIQMEWFIHPIQQQREERREKVINGIWLWSGTSLPAGHRRVGTLLSPPLTDRGGNEIAPTLRSAYLANDWGAWAAAMIELERNYFKPLCTALKKREITQLQLRLSNSQTLLGIQTSTTALKKFWRRPTFKNLIT